MGDRVAVYPPPVGGGGEPVSHPRLLVAATAGILAPVIIPVIGLWATGTTEVTLEGPGALAAVATAEAVIGYVAAQASGTRPMLVGALTGVGLAAAATVRGAHPVAVALPFAFGAVGGGVARLLRRPRPAPRGSTATLAALGVALAIPLALLAQVSPEDAARSVIGEEPTLATYMPREGHAAGAGYAYVAAWREAPRGGLRVVRVVPHGIGSWAAEATFVAPDQCFPPHGTSTGDVHTGLSFAPEDVRRVCWLFEERLVVGRAPAEARVLEVTTAGGEVRRSGIEPGAGYVLSGSEGEGDPAVRPLRVAFLGRDGRLLDARPSPETSWNDWYWRAPIIAGLMTERDFWLELRRPPATPMTVSVWLLRLSEYRAACGPPPRGDWVVLAHITPPKGPSTELAVGAREPKDGDLNSLGSLDLLPRTAIVGPSTGAPCFL